MGRCDSQNLTPKVGVAYDQVTTNELSEKQQNNHISGTAEGRIIKLCLLLETKGMDIEQYFGPVQHSRSHPQNFKSRRVSKIPNGTAKIN